MNSWSVYAIIAILIAAGGAVWYVQDSISSISISGIEIIDMGSPGLGYVTFRANLIVSNPSPVTVLLENFKYEVFLGNTMIAKDNFGGKIIEARNETRVEIDQRIWTNNLVEGIRGFIEGKELVFVIKGIAVLNIYGKRIIRPIERRIPIKGEPISKKNQDEIEGRMGYEIIS